MDGTAPVLLEKSRHWLCPSPFGPSTAAVLEFQCHEASDGDRKVELADDRLQVGQASGERIDRHDVAIARCRQRRKAEIQHCGKFVRTARRGSKIAEGSRAQVPYQAKGRGEYHPEAQINHDGT